MEKLLDVWKLLHFICRFLLSCFLLLSFFFQVPCVSPIAEAVFVALIITSGNVFYRAVGFKIIYSHGWQTDNPCLLTCTDSYKYVEEGPAKQRLNPLTSLDPCYTICVINRSNFILRVVSFFGPSVLIGGSSTALLF